MPSNTAAGHVRRRGSRRPAVRAASVKDVLQYLDKWEPGATERVRSIIPADVLQVIDATPRLGWIDIEDDVYVPTAIWTALGDDDAIDMMREFLIGHFQIPLLSPLVRSTRSLFGLTPISVLRIIPSGWPLIYRDFCTLEVQSVGEDTGRLVFEDVAQLAIDSDAYFASFGAILLGVLDLTGREGEVALLEQDRTARRATFELRW